VSTLVRAAARQAWAAVAPRVAPVRSGDVVEATQRDAAWEAVVSTLRVLVTMPDADAQAVITAARQANALSLDDTHTLLDAFAVVTRSRERDESALSGADAPVIRAAVDVVDRLCRDDAFVPPPLTPPPRSAVDGATPRIPRDAASWAPPSTPAVESAVLAMPAPASGGGGRTATLVVGGLALLIVGVGAGVLFAGRGTGNAARPDRRAEADSPALADCRQAFERGDVARAQQACAAAAAQARQRPADAVALVYLARMKRGAGDLQGAIADADLAQRLLPANGIALRELGAAFLDANAPTEARRAFVAAVQNDTDDRVAMAGLACALHRMGRVDEAGRWRARSTVSAFDACLAAPPGR
jgi:hypothetical protein